MSTQKRTEEAIAEAERFLRRAKAWHAMLKNEDIRIGIYSYPARSAMLRASMDLTRALAQLRKRD